MTSEYYTVPTDVAVKGKSFKIEPFKVKHIRYVYVAVDPILKLTSGNATPEEIMEGVPKALTAMAAIYGVEIDWLEDLTIEEFMSLLIPTVQANLDFFIQKVLPKVTTLLGTLTSLDGKM